MPAKTRLTNQERNFFSLINQAALTNPFSFDRNAIDMKISGLFPGTTREKILEKMIAEVKRRITAFEKSEPVNYQRFKGNDRELVRNSFLFHCYHQYCPKFDRLITDQIKAGDKSIKVPFAKEVFSYLENRGFGSEEIRHFFSLSYQLRRAFYFINKSLVGESPCMVSFREDLWNNIFTYNIDLYNKYMWNRMEDFSTLLLGETGTGKGAAAAAIGRSGFIPFDANKQCFEESFTKSFISLNLSQCTESLIESELFGHKKGAFTGAVGDHKGIFALCSPNGAIFLDEIGEVSGPVQIKLLKVLEERSFSPISSHEIIRFMGRIIAATNRPLEEITGKKILRDDFFYRLCSDIIHVPPLRQRIQEDPAELDRLVMHTLYRILGHSSPDLSHRICNTIKRDIGYKYDWPGNVRELSQCIRRILLSKSYKPNPDIIPRPATSPLAANVDAGDIDVQSLVQGYCQMLYEKHGTYGEVARITRLDRRTVKKHIGN